MSQKNCFMSNCNHRITTANRNRIGQPSLWPLYLMHVGDEWQEEHQQKYVCDACNLKIKCHAKNHETRNFKRKPAENTTTRAASPRRMRSKRPCTSLEFPANDVTPLDAENIGIGSQRTVIEEPDVDLFDEEIESESFLAMIDEEFESVESSLGSLSDSIVPSLESMPVVLEDTSQSMLNEDSQMSCMSTSSSSTIKTRRLTDIRSVISTQKSCFICHNGQGRARIPNQALTQVWMEKEILIPHGNRCCSSHLIGKNFTDEAMSLIISTRDGILMSDEELCNWILELSKISKGIDMKRRRFNFDNPNDVPEIDYPSLVGFLKVDFDAVLFEILPHVRNSINRSTRNALAIFLMFLRHDLSQTVLQNLFGVSSQSCVSDTITAVSEALSKSFVKKNLGFQHISREEALRLHSRNMYFTLFEEVDRSKIFLIMDATYVYIEKPRDHELQKLTYSGQKKRNLVKPFMIVLQSGYILEASGPWYATGANNDAGILKAIISQLPADSEYLNHGDHDVLDRGFRDIITRLEDLEHFTHMPELMNPKEKQFTTRQGNESRRVTLL